MATTKDGLPRRAFAYAPTSDPSTWKLPYLKADGSVDSSRLPMAAAALSEGGHRGEQADVPANMVAAVKSRLRQAYRRWKGSDVEYPGSIRESDWVSVEEAESLLDETDAYLEEHDVPGTPHEHTFGRIPGGAGGGATTRAGVKAGEQAVTVPGHGLVYIKKSDMLSGAATAEDEVTYSVDGKKYHTHIDALIDPASRAKGKADIGGRIKRQLAALKGDTSPGASTRRLALTKLAAQYRESDVPDDIEQPTFREATFLLDRAACRAQVVFSPEGDAFVIPEWTGAFNAPYLADEDHQQSEEAVWQVRDATRLLGDLYRLKGNEADEPGQSGMIDSAIAALSRFIKAEGDEIGGEAPVAEAGKRHATKDETVLRQFHDLLKTLGVECEDPARGIIPEIAVVEAAKGTTPEAITFRESGWESDAVVTLREADAKFDRANKTVWITPIKPGWGNARDKFFYTEDALKEATESGLFNHIKMFKDHPTKSGEKELPERSVKDWFATTREAEWDHAKGSPRVPIKVHDDDVFKRFEEAPEQVAFSVLGGGLARPGKVNGKDGRIVESLKNVRSVDWVTEAGAGGAIDFAESAAKEHEITMEINDLSDEQIKAEAERRGMNFKESEKDAADSDSEGAADEAVSSPAGGTEAASDTRAEGDEARAEGGVVATQADVSVETKVEPAATDNKESAQTEEERIAAAVEAALKRRDEAVQTSQQVKEAAKKAIAEELAASALPRRAKDIIVADLREAAFGSGYVYADEPALRAGVQGEIKKAAALLGLAVPDSKVRGLGENPDTGEKPVRESVADRLDRKFGPSGAPSKDDNAQISESGEAASVSTGASAVADRIGSKFGR